VVALSGPGRIDVVDGQTRYEVARSLVDHGDLVIRDPAVWFVVFPGRDGRPYTKYRFPQSAIGVAAILAADATGPVREARRHFFFTLTSAVACAILAATYAALFRALGHAPRAALFWAAGGIFCTPSWFYGTSTFDDILGSAAVVLAVSSALALRQRHPRAGATIAGLTLGLAFNCKEPLGIFVLPVLATIYDPELELRSQWDRLATVAALLGAGVAVYMGYDLYKFPPGSSAGHAEIMKQYGPLDEDSEAGPCNVVQLECRSLLRPSDLFCFYGLRVWWIREKLFCWCLTGAIAVVLLHFVAHLFKGDPAWGPRYLTRTSRSCGSSHRPVPPGPPMGCCGALGLVVVQLGALASIPTASHRTWPAVGFYVSNPGLTSILSFPT
jgi:hypothetical protein